MQKWISKLLPLCYIRCCLHLTFSQQLMCASLMELCPRKTCGMAIYFRRHYIKTLPISSTKYLTQLGSAVWIYCFIMMNSSVISPKIWPANEGRQSYHQKIIRLFTFLSMDTLAAQSRMKLDMKQCMCAKAKEALGQVNQDHGMLLSADVTRATKCWPLTTISTSLEQMRPVRKMLYCQHVRDKIKMKQIMRHKSWGQRNRVVTAFFKIFQEREKTSLFF